MLEVHLMHLNPATNQLQVFLQSEYISRDGKCLDEIESLHGFSDGTFISKYNQSTS